METKSERRDPLEAIAKAQMRSDDVSRARRVEKERNRLRCDLEGAESL